MDDMTSKRVGEQICREHLHGSGMVGLGGGIEGVDTDVATMGTPGGDAPHLRLIWT